MEHEREQKKTLKKIYGERCRKWEGEKCFSKTEILQEKLDAKFVQL